MNKVVIAKMGVEGGGVTIFGRRADGVWSFWQEGASMYLDENDDEDWRLWITDPVSELSLALPDKWWMMYPTEVHPGFVEQFQREYERCRGMQDSGARRCSSTSVGKSFSAFALPEGDVLMTDIEKARHLFQEAGVAFPTIPQQFAVGLKEQGKWLFSTRKIDMSPYNLQHYVHEVDESHVEDYAILSHSGHGSNSYAIQYYLLHGPLHMFLHLGWGGVYMDADAAAAKIQECFSLADQIVPAAMTVGKLAAGERLTIVGSDFYGSYWSAPGQSRQEEGNASQGPADVLAEVLNWLKSPAPNRSSQQPGPA